MRRILLSIAAFVAIECCAQSRITSEIFPRGTPVETWIWRLDWDDRYLGLQEPVIITPDDTIYLEPGDYVMDSRVGGKSIHAESVHIPKEQISFHVTLYLNPPPLTRIRLWRPIMFMEF